MFFKFPRCSIIISWHHEDGEKIELNKFFARNLGLRKLMLYKKVLLIIKCKINVVMYQEQYFRIFVFLRLTLSIFQIPSLFYVKKYTSINT